MGSWARARWKRSRLSSLPLGWRLTVTQAPGFSPLFVSDAELGFLGLIEAVAEAGFVSADDAIRRNVFVAGKALSARDLALGFIVLEVRPCHVRPAIGAVARAERARVVAFRLRRRALGRDVVGCERGSHGILLSMEDTPGADRFGEPLVL